MADKQGTIKDVEVPSEVKSTGVLLKDTVWCDKASFLDPKENKHCCILISKWSVAITDRGTLPAPWVYITGEFLVLYEDGNLYGLPMTATNSFIVEIVEPDVVKFNDGMHAIFVGDPSQEFQDQLKEQKTEFEEFDLKFYNTAFARKKLYGNDGSFFDTHPDMFGLTTTNMKSGILKGVMKLLHKESEHKKMVKENPDKASRHPLSKDEQSFLDSTRKTGGNQSWRYNQQTKEWSFNGEVQYTEMDTADELNACKINV